MLTLPHCYRIEVACILPQAWSSNFAGLSINHDGDKTILYGKLADQAALHGVLMRIRDLGLPLLLVKQLEIDSD